MKNTLFWLSFFPHLLGAFEADFTDKERQLLESGEQVLREQKVRGEPWPVVTGYKLLNVNPEHAMAIFAAYDHQKNYIPNMTVSTPLSQETPLKTRVAYTLDMGWPVGEVRYVHDHELKVLQANQVYRLDWVMIESTSTEFVEGFAEFRPWKNQQTLMIYKNHVRPKSIFGSLVRGFMIRDLKKSLKATADEIENHQEKTQQYLMILRDSLAGKFRWRPQ